MADGEEDLDRLIAMEADPAKREKLAQIRSELYSPRARAALAEAERLALSRSATTKLRFHVYAVPYWLSATALAASVIAFIFVWSPAPDADWLPSASNVRLALGLIVLASGVVSFWLMTRFKRFSVTIEPTLITCAAFGDKYARLRIGSMPLRDLQAIEERTGDSLLELRGNAGTALEVPADIHGYGNLKTALEGLLRLRGPRRPP